jgi:hypothetical protein
MKRPPFHPEIFRMYVAQCLAQSPLLAARPKRARDVALRRSVAALLAFSAAWPVGSA